MEERNINDWEKEFDDKFPTASNHVWSIGGKYRDGGRTEKRELKVFISKLLSEAREETERWIKKLEVYPKTVQEAEQLGYERGFRDLAKAHQTPEEMEEE